jgi:hypothetical protein
MNPQPAREHGEEIMSTTATKLTNTEIARRINEHLKRFESDPVINVPMMNRGMNTTPYYNAGAFNGGRYVTITYVSYQSASFLTKAKALEYLAWLDAGNVGKHFRLTHPQT